MSFLQSLVSAGSCCHRADCADQHCTGAQLARERQQMLLREFQIMRHALRRIADNPDLTHTGARNLARLALSAVGGSS